MLKISLRDAPNIYMQPRNDLIWSFAIVKENEYESCGN